MKKPIFVMILLLLGVSFMASQAFAAMTVNAGTVGTFDGASDLDLDGSFPYTINFTIDGDTNDYEVNGQTFSPIEDFTGASISGPFLWASQDWATKPEYGTSTDDNNLEDLMHDYCYGRNSTDVNIDLAVVSGQEYKLQLLFSENWNSTEAKYGLRAFDILVEGVTVVDEFDALTEMGAWDTVGYPPNGVVYTYTFTAGDDNLDIDLPAGSYPAIGGLTLEAVGVPEPGTWALLLMGMAGLFALRRRNR